MTMDERRKIQLEGKHAFLSLLSNVDDSILNIGFGVPPNYFYPQKIPVSSALVFLRPLLELPEQEIDFVLDMKWRCIRPSSDSVYAFFWVGDLANTDFADEPARLHEALEKPIAAQLGLCRLFQKGSITAPATFVFEFKDRDLLVWSSSMHEAYVAPDPFHVRPRDRDSLQAFIDNLGPWDFPDYIRVAMSYFHQSFVDVDRHIALLLLMISCEVLFNDGQTELRYKVARGIAVLTGGTSARCGRVFNCMLDLYDKRSRLVHRGDAKRIKSEDIEFLRERLRKVFRILMARKWSKDELRNKLNASGYGRRF